MKINVTKEDIDLGSRLNPFGCPVARAINRHLWFKNASVCCGRVIRCGHLTVKSYGLPESVYSKIREYDRTSYMAPFEFDLPL